MSNMSYCRFQNTFQDLRDCVQEMDDAYNIKDMELSDDEARAMKQMYSWCERFIENFDRLHFADTFEDELVDEDEV